MLAISIVVSVVILAFVFFTDPRRRYAEPAHAARADRRAGILDRTRFPKVPHQIKDETGKIINTKGMHVGSVFGKSCAQYGLSHGSIYFADKLKEVGKHQIKVGDIVVVEAEAKMSNLRHRLRKIREIDGDVVHFYPDAKNEDHNARNRNQVFARVSHVLN